MGKLGVANFCVVAHKLRILRGNRRKVSGAKYESGRRLDFVLKMAFRTEQ